MHSGTENDAMDVEMTDFKQEVMTLLCARPNALRPPSLSFRRNVLRHPDVYNPQLDGAGSSEPAAQASSYFRLEVNENAVPIIPRCVFSLMCRGAEKFPHE